MMKVCKWILGLFLSFTISVTAQSVRSAVYVTQVGDYNSVFSNTNTLGGQSTYNQSGDYNSIDVSVKANSINQQVEQLGYGNSFENYSFNSFNKQEMEVIQKGNHIDVQVFGSNSMSEGMKISVTGNNKAVIVRNYN